MSDLSKAEKELASAREEWDGLKGQLAELEAERVDLLARQQDDLGTVKADELLTVARKQSQLRVEIAAVDATIEELERRVEAQAKEVARLDDRYMAAVAESRAGELRAVEAELAVIVDKAHTLTEKLFLLRQAIAHETGRTLDCAVGMSFRSAVKVQQQKFERGL